MAWWLVNGRKLMSWTSFLIKPFQTHTDILQSDTLALSNVIPVLLDLTCHLQEPCHNQRVALSLLRELKSRFAQILDPQEPDFDPLAATACFWNPSVGMILLNSSDTEPVLKAAQHHLLQLITEVFDPNFLCFVFLNFLFIYLFTQVTASCFYNLLRNWWWCITSSTM